MTWYGWVFAEIIGIPINLLRLLTAHRQYFLSLRVRGEVVGAKKFFTRAGNSAIVLARIEIHLLHFLTKLTGQASPRKVL